MKKDACSSNGKITKEAFLSMIGAKKFTKTNFNLNSSFQNQQSNLIKNILKENNGNKQVTAAQLGITVSSLNRKLNKETITIIADDELESPNPTRKYFEKIKIDWEITSFDYQAKEVCVNLKKQKCTTTSCSPPINLSVTVSNFKMM